MLEPARRLSYVLAALASSICVVATPTIAQDAYQLPNATLSTGGDLRVPADEPRYAAIVMDAATGEILYQKRADSPRYPASVTKIMTMYLAFEALSTGRLHESDLITVSPEAAAQPPTKLGLAAGDTITVEDALHAMAVHSANDMAVAVAEKIGGSVPRFAAMMTMKAQELGMTHSRFVNPNGLPDSRHITSAHDIAILCRAVLRDYPQYYHYFGDTEFSYRGSYYHNTNHLLGSMSGVDGFKTGYTNAAGHNLAASAVRDGRRLIVVVLGGSSNAERNSNVEDLLLTGFDVEQRRANGETLMLTQNMFEAPPQGGAVTPEVGEGDGDDPIDMVLSEAQRGAPVTMHGAGVTQLAATRPTLAAETPTHQGFLSTGAGLPPPKAQAVARDWSVQVGDFAVASAATHQIDVVADGFKDIFDDREGRVDHVGRRYRAVFTGFSEDEARSACATVQSKNVACITTPR